DSRCDGVFGGMVAVFAGIFYLHRPDTGNGQYVRQSDHAGTDHALAVFLHVDPADRSGDQLLFRGQAPKAGGSGGSETAKTLKLFCFRPPAKSSGAKKNLTILR